MNTPKWCRECHHAPSEGSDPLRSEFGGTCYCKCHKQADLAPEMIKALQALDKAFWPAANGWGDDIQDAIQEAHTLLAKLDLAPTETHGKP